MYGKYDLSNFCVHFLPTHGGFVPFGGSISHNVVASEIVIRNNGAPFRVGFGVHFPAAFRFVRFLLQKCVTLVAMSRRLHVFWGRGRHGDAGWITQNKEREREREREPARE